MHRAPYRQAPPSGVAEPHRAPVDEPRRLLERNVGTIRRMALQAAARCSLGADDAEEFVSHVYLRLIDNDYRLLRRFRGDSPLESYLSAVILNLARDYRIALWGKWRPSAIAQRLGRTAMRLEQLLYRDAYPFSQAVRLLGENLGVGASHRRLAQIVRRLPRRTRRVPVRDPEAVPLATTGRVEQPLEARRLRRASADVRAALREAIASLPEEDVRLLRARFIDGLTVAAIARSTGENQRRLYGRFNAILKRLRETLARRIDGPAEAIEVSAWRGSELDLSSLLHTGP